MEFRAPSQLGKRPRGYVPEDVAARRRGDGGGDGDDSDEDARAADALKTGTERVVEAALAAEAAAKDHSQAAKQAAKKAAKKSVSFKEPQDEEEEDACMTQAAAEAAAAKRAAQRRGAKDLGGTDLLDDVTLAEERAPAAAAAGDEGEFEPFNLDAERAAGDFDADGNYTERRVAAAEAEEDAWLEGVPLAEAMAEKCRREAEAEASKPDKLSEAQLGDMKAEIAALLQPGETVLRALKRMGGGGGGGGSAAAAAAGRGRGRGRGAGSSSTVAPEHRAAFERLTELSSLLMAFGEYDVYAFTRESFERAARAHAAAAKPAAVDMFGGDDDDDEDIFADEPRPKRHAGPAAPVVGASASAASSSTPHFGAWTVAQLRRFLEARGGQEAARSAVEKSELVAAAAAAGAGLSVPAGYQWHPDSGLYASSTTQGLFYDLCSGLFADSQGQWYAWDGGSNAFVPWTGEPAK